MISRLLLMLVLLSLAPLAFADGLIIIHDPPHHVPHHFRFAPLEITYHRVKVKIDGDVATTTVDQEFRNPSSARLEGTYLFPLPEGAHIDKFEMDVNGTMQEAELLDAKKARELYEEIVRKQRDPALMEYVGRGAFKVRIFPIEPNSRKQIRIKYSQLIKSNDGLSEYVYPLNTEKFSSKLIGDVSVSVDIESDDPLKSIYCPSHKVEIDRDGEKSATVEYEERNARPDSDFRLVFSRDSDPVDLRMLTYATPGDDGYFLLMASPGIDLTDDAIQERDICFVVDTSGSMAGEKIKQAKKAMRFCVDNLNKGDRFNIIRFSTEAQPLWTELKEASESSRTRATEFIDSFKPIGGTAIEDALKAATKLGEKREDAEDRPYVIVFLTDGQPTVGETKDDKLVDVTDRKKSTRIFCFGIGDDINTHLLDRIADKTGAFTTYVGAKEDLEVKVSSFYTGIQAPVLTDVTLEFTGSGIRAEEMMPRTLPDLFKGQTMYVTGRYHGSGESAVVLKGKINGKTQTFAEDVRLPKEDTTRPYVSHLWATRRVGFLLDEIRLRGESDELKDEVTRLAREFGIVTPYTAYLILEDENERRVPLTLQTMRELDRDAVGRERVESYYSSNRGDSSELEKAGKQGVINARAMQDLKMANTPAMPAGPAAEALGRPLAAAEPQGYRQTTNYAQQARMVNGRAFYQNGTTWTDATAQRQQNLKTQQVKFGSDEYFALLRKSRDLAAWLSLGEEVDVVHDGVLYQIRS